MEKENKSLYKSGGQKRTTVEVAVSQHSQTIFGLQCTGFDVNRLILEKIAIDASANFQKSCTFCDVSKGRTLRTFQAYFQR